MSTLSEPVEPDKHSEESEHSKGLDWRLVVDTAGLIVLFAVAVIYLYQLVEMRIANNLAQETANRAVSDSALSSRNTQMALQISRDAAAAARVNADAARINADTAKRALDFTKQSTELSQRSWVIGIQAESNLIYYSRMLEGKKPRVAIALRNSGRIPATDVTLARDVRIFTAMPT